MSSTRRNANRARCHYASCDKFAQTRGLCKAHGGGSRCRDPHCSKLAQSRGLCIAHGGGRRCQFIGCKKLAQSKGNCISHGGGRRCTISNCRKFSQVKGRCKSHSKLVTTEAHSTSYSVKTPPLSIGSSAVSPNSIKLSIDFLINPLSHTSFFGGKVSDHQPMQMPSRGLKAQLAYPFTYSDTSCLPQFDRHELASQRSLLPFLEPSKSITSTPHYAPVLPYKNRSW